MRPRRRSALSSVATATAIPPIREAVLRGLAASSRAPDLALVSQPAEYLKGLYDIGAPGFDGSKLFPVIEAVVATLGLPARMVRDGVGNPIRVEAYAVDVTVAPGDPPGLDLAFALPVSANGLTQSATLPAGFAATVTADLGFAAGTTATWRPPLDIALKPSAVTNFSGRVEATLKGSPAEPYVLLGQPAKSRIEIGEVSFSAAAAFAWDAGRNAAVTRPSASGRLARGKVLIDTSTADGFIATLTSGICAELNFELGFDVDPVAGLRFRGSSTLEIALPVHANLGPIEIPTVYLLAGFEDGRVPIEVSIDFGAKLGPIQASVSRIGLNVTLILPSGRRQFRSGQPRLPLQAAERHRALRSTAAASRAAASSRSTYPRASMPARSSCPSRAS